VSIWSLENNSLLFDCYLWLIRGTTQGVDMAAPKVSKEGMKKHREEMEKANREFEDSRYKYSVENVKQITKDMLKYFEDNPMEELLQAWKGTYGITKMEIQYLKDKSVEFRSAYESVLTTLEKRIFNACKRGQTPVALGMFALKQLSWRDRTEVEQNTTVTVIGSLAKALKKTE
jgi:hypothetical protein